MGDDDDDPENGSVRHEFMHLPEHIQRRMAGVLRMHVLGSVRTRVEAGHLDFINEIRPLTCIFLGFPSLLDERDTATHSDQVSCVQFAVQQIQNVMRKWDGSFMQFRYVDPNNQWDFMFIKVSLMQHLHLPACSALAAERIARCHVQCFVVQGICYNISCDMLYLLETGVMRRALLPFVHLACLATHMRTTRLEASWLLWSCASASGRATTASAWG